MKSVRLLIIALLLFLTACTHTVTTNTPQELPTGSPSPTPTAIDVPTPAPTPSPSPVNTQATPVQGLTHPVPYISEMRLYSDIELFTLEDLALGPVTITSTQEDILQAFGEPDSITNHPFHSLGVIQTYHYDGTRIDFLLTDGVYVMHTCSYTEGDLKTPRKIGIGSAVRDTIHAYVGQIEKAMDNRAIFYRSNAGSISPEAVPPSGIMYRGENTAEWILQFVIPLESNPYAGYTQEQIEDMYQTIWVYTLRFTTAYGKVTRIDMSLGHYME